MFKSFLSLVLIVAVTGCSSGLGQISNQEKQGSGAKAGKTAQQGSSKKQGSGAKATGSDSQKSAYDHPGMLDPSQAVMTAPAKFKVKFETTKGDFILECHRDWSPNGADRFYSMVKIGYFKDILVFRAIRGFMFQFGIHGDPDVNAKWGEARFNDDPKGKQSNKLGYITFAKTGAPNSRSTQLFINLRNNSGLDGQGFTPFGKVVEGMDVVNKINTEYGENRVRNFQGMFQARGNAYAKEKYPNLDTIKSVTLVEDKK